MTVFETKGTPWTVGSHRTPWSPTGLRATGLGLLRAAHRRWKDGALTFLGPRAAHRRRKTASREGVCLRKGEVVPAPGRGWCPATHAPTGGVARAATRIRIPNLGRGGLGEIGLLCAS